MNKKNGFTIVEMMVVIVVIGILATISIVSYNYIRRDSVESKVQSHVSQVRTYLLAYRPLNSGMYPPATAGAINEDDIRQFVQDDEMPFKPYVTSPNRKKFCIYVEVKRYPDMKYVLRDLSGNGNIETETSPTVSCPASITD